MLERCHRLLTAFVNALFILLTSRQQKLWCPWIKEINFQQKCLTTKEQKSLPISRMDVSTITLNADFFQNFFKIHEIDFYKIHVHLHHGMWMDRGRQVTLCINIHTLLLRELSKNASSTDSLASLLHWGTMKHLLLDVVFC